MRNILLLPLWILLVSSCASKRPDSTVITATEKPKKIEKTVEQAPKSPGIVVDNKDLEVLEKMNKAVEMYVLKNEKKSFTGLCKDTRFDCYMNEKPFPKRKKKIIRNIPPYASGSKMGLQGENRVHVKYEFFP